MLYTSKGIVIHHFKYKEKSVIAKIYTEKYGLQSFIINGVRGKKSKNKAALLQPLSLIEINATKKENKGLQQIKEIKAAYLFQEIPFHIHKTSIAFFIAEILYKSIKEEEKNESLFQFLYGSIQILDLQTAHYVNFHLLFLAQLTKHLGFLPQGIKTSFKEPTLFFDLQEGIFTSTTPPHHFFLEHPLSHQLKLIFGINFDEVGRLNLDNNTRKLILNAILNYYSLHLSNFEQIKSKEVLEEILK
ncbi:MAG: DNA repair protein RecO [Vicingus serpentipes]|nr:DNA repair protein RecO [Vicingus serpentipes]